MFLEIGFFDCLKFYNLRSEPRGVVRAVELLNLKWLRHQRSRVQSHEGQFLGAHPTSGNISALIDPLIEGAVPWVPGTSWVCKMGSEPMLQNKNIKNYSLNSPIFWRRSWDVFWNLIHVCMKNSPIISWKFTGCFSSFWFTLWKRFSNWIFISIFLWKWIERKWL